MPLDRFDHPEQPKPGKVWVPPKRAPREAKPPEPRAPRRFRVVDVMTRRVLQEDAGVRETLELLGGIARSNDVNVSVWEPAGERWRLLSMAEQQAVWDRRRTTG